MQTALVSERGAVARLVQAETAKNLGHELVRRAGAWARCALAAAGVGVYRPTGVFRDDETGLVIGVVPAAPPRVVVLSCYAPADDVDQADSLIDLQSRVRGATSGPREALDLIDAAFEL